MRKTSLILFIYFFFLNINFLNADDSFEEWKINFKIYAQKQNISLATINDLIDNSNFLPNVIKLIP